MNCFHRRVRAFSLVLVSIVALSCGVQRKTAGTSAGTAVETYFTIDEMPDLVKCLPSPPSWGSQEFLYDSLRYYWGKRMRLDERRAKVAEADAVWTLEALFGSFSDQFGMVISKETTPKIWDFLERSISTIDLIRIRPKAHFARKRPFEYFNDHILTAWEEDELRGEGLILPATRSAGGAQPCCLPRSTRPPRTSCSPGDGTTERAGSLWVPIGKAMLTRAASRPV